jgi:glycerol kinase
LKADGGAAANNFTMQFMADLLAIPIARPQSAEATGLGAAFLAGLTSGFWQDKSEILSLDLPTRIFKPEPMDRPARLAAWHAALSQVRNR